MQVTRYKIPQATPLLAAAYQEVRQALQGLLPRLLRRHVPQGRPQHGAVGVDVLLEELPGHLCQRCHQALALARNQLLRGERLLQAVLRGRPVPLKLVQLAADGAQVGRKVLDGDLHVSRFMTCCPTPGQAAAHTRRYPPERVRQPPRRLTSGRVPGGRGGGAASKSTAPAEKGQASQEDCAAGLFTTEASSCAAAA